MVKRFVLVALFLFLAPALGAQSDLTGTWAGSFMLNLDGQTEEETAHMVLKQKGAELTGTAGPNAEKQWPISKGKVEAGTATFEVQSDGPLIAFSLKIVDGHLKGDAKAEHEGRKMTGVLDLLRK